MSEDLDDYRSRAKARLERTKKESFKLNPGDNTIRILKTPAGTKSPAVMYEFSMHSEVGPEKAWVRCGIDPITKKGKCWICERLVPQLEKKGNDTRAAKLTPDAKIVFQVARVKEDGSMDGPHLYYPSGKKADELVTLIMSKKRDYVDPKRGYNLSISRTGTGKMDTRYGPIEPDMEPSKVPRSIMDALKPFDELKAIPLYSEDKQKKAYYGENGETEEDLEEEKRLKGKSSREDDDEDDEKQANPEKQAKYDKLMKHYRNAKKIGNRVEAMAFKKKAYALKEKYDLD